MSDQDKEKDTGHLYDGIRELDNRLPNWWLGILWGSIVWAAAYFLYYVMGSGPTLVKTYETEHMEAAIAASQNAASKPTLSENALLAIRKDPARLAQGKEVFTSKCLPCHGAAGQGGIGPNLTDDYWIHGGKLTEMLTVVTNGVADKGMPPWGPVLKEEEIQSVVGYIRSLHGTNPAGAKAPQGEKVTITE